MYHLHLLFSLPWYSICPRGLQDAPRGSTRPLARVQDVFQRSQAASKKPPKGPPRKPGLARKNGKRVHNDAPNHVAIPKQRLYERNSQATNQITITHPTRALRDTITATRIGNWPPGAFRDPFGGLLCHFWNPFWGLLAAIWGRLASSYRLLGRQVAPRAPQEGPKSHEELPKRPQETPRGPKTIRKGVSNQRKI